MNDLTKETCLRLLQMKAEALHEAGETRFPKRSDFTEREVMAIKAFFGPWPRALEAAGLKACRADDRKQKNLDKRIRAKRRRREMQSTTESKKEEEVS